MEPSRVMATGSLADHDRPRNQEMRFGGKVVLMQARLLTRLRPREDRGDAALLGGWRTEMQKATALHQPSPTSLRAFRPLATRVSPGSIVRQRQRLVATSRCEPVFLRGRLPVTGGSISPSSKTFFGPSSEGHLLNTPAAFFCQEEPLSSGGRNVSFHTTERVRTMRCEHRHIPSRTAAPHCPSQRQPCQDYRRPVRFPGPAQNEVKGRAFGVEPL